MPCMLMFFRTTARMVPMCSTGKLCTDLSHVSFPGLPPVNNCKCFDPTASQGELEFEVSVVRSVVAVWEIGVRQKQVGAALLVQGKPPFLKLFCLGYVHLASTVPRTSFLASTWLLSSATFLRFGCD